MYTEDQMTGWIKGEPPVREGVYQQLCGLKVGVGFQKYKNGHWGPWRKTIADAEESEVWYAHRGDPWRGLNHNPDDPVKPKSKGNKRKTMYVVCHKSSRATEAVFSNKENAQEYAEHLNFPVYITKIRVRTPKHN